MAEFELEILITKQRKTQNYLENICANHVSCINVENIKATAKILTVNL